MSLVKINDQAAVDPEIITAIAKQGNQWYVYIPFPLYSRIEASGVISGEQLQDLMERAKVLHFALPFVDTNVKPETAFLVTEERAQELMTLLDVEAQMREG